MAESEKMENNNNKMGQPGLEPKARRVMSPLHPCHFPAANFPKSYRKASLSGYCELLSFIALFCTPVVHKWSTEKGLSGFTIGESLS